MSRGPAPFPRFAGRVSHSAPRRISPVLGLLLAVLGIAASVLNSQRYWLVCERGQWIASKGLPLPLGRAKLPSTEYPPLPSPETCSEERFDDARELRTRYDRLAAREKARSQPPRSSPLAGIVEAWRKLSAFDQPTGSQPRALVLARVQAEVAAARIARQRARLAIEHASSLGIDRETIERLRRQLDDTEDAKASQRLDTGAAASPEGGGSTPAATSNAQERPL